MRSLEISRFRFRLVAVVAVLAGGAITARAQVPAVVRPVDPSLSLKSKDAQRVQFTLGLILGRLEQSNGMIVPFANPEDLKNFVTTLDTQINIARGGRTQETVDTGGAVVDLLSQIRMSTDGQTSPQVESSMLVQLAQQTARLLACVVFEGERLALVAPSPQAAPPGATPSAQAAHVLPNAVPLTSVAAVPFQPVPVVTSEAASVPAPASIAASPPLPTPGLPPTVATAR